jgi:hypothetical protein
MTTFASLKRGRTTLTKTLTNELEKLKSTKSYEDDRIWKIFLDKTKANGFAVVRPLPAPKGEDVPWQRFFSHSFKGPGGYYIENCPTTLGHKCPVCDANTKLWDTGIEANRKIAKDRKRKLTYISNILVVQDKKQPDAVGKVFLWQYGKKIFDKISEAMQPEFEDKQPLNPFDFWEGADFSLRVKHVDGYWNYDTSTFGDPSALLDGDEKKLEAIWEQEYSLMEFVDPKRFKKYEDLAARFDRVQGTVVEAKPSDTAGTSEVQSQPTAEAKPAGKTRKSKAEKSAEAKPQTTSDTSPIGEMDNSNDVMAKFARLAED